MLSHTHKNLIEIARLGLVGNQQDLLAFLKNVAINEINNNRHQVYNSIMALLSETERIDGSSVQAISSQPADDYGVDLVGIWLPPNVQKRIDRVIKYFISTDQQMVDSKLNRVLLYGPPGTGKTTLGFYISSQLNLPIRYVKVTDVISSRLGETMKNISDIFHSPKKEVIFIDEFDAFAKTRSDGNDVGELKRIVNSLIQTLDFYASNKVVIVATNLIETLDSAILRRFPFKIEVGVLTETEKKDFFLFLSGKLEGSKISLSSSEQDRLIEFFNLLRLDTVDEIKSIVEKVKLEAVINNKDVVTYRDFLEVFLLDGYLSKLKHIKTQNHKLLAKLLSDIERAGYSKGAVAQIIGVHRNTYTKYS